MAKHSISTYSTHFLSGISLIQYVRDSFVSEIEDFGFLNYFICWFILVQPLLLILIVILLRLHGTRSKVYRKFWL